MTFMGEILSLQQFQDAARGHRGIPAEYVAEIYDRAARASRTVLTGLPSLGVFSSQQDRIAAFLEACRHLDRLVEEGQLSEGEPQCAIFLIILSDKRFFRAAQAFTAWAVPRYRDDLTTDSETADLFMRSNAVQY